MADVEQLAIVRFWSGFAETSQVTACWLLHSQKVST
jgi:hypothetical protein